MLNMYNNIAHQGTVQDQPQALQNSFVNNDSNNTDCDIKRLGLGPKGHNTKTSKTSALP